MDLRGILEKRPQKALTAVSQFERPAALRPEMASSSKLADSRSQCTVFPRVVGLGFFGDRNGRSDRYARECRRSGFFNLDEQEAIVGGSSLCHPISEDCFIGFVWFDGARNRLGPP